MNNQELLNASGRIIGRNVNNKIVAATVIWNGELSRLAVTYYIDGIVSEDELELCDLSLTELLAEFADVQIAASQCLSTSGDVIGVEDLTGLVYRR